LARRKSGKNHKSLINESDSNELADTDMSLLFNKVFKDFENKIELTQLKMHEYLLESIYENTNNFFEFYSDKRLKISRSNSTNNIRNEERGIILNPICNVIPTIALFTGINGYDYNHLCESYIDLLKHNCTHLFTIGENNSQNVKSILNSIYSQWEKDLVNELESTTSNVDSFQMECKRNAFTFRHLCESILKKNTFKIVLPSVIFYFKQFELIPKETIESFVSLISCYLEELPIYFIIELSSQSNILYQQLSGPSISKLCIKKLHFMSPEEYIESFIKHLFIKQTFDFKLSGEILNYLIDIYYNYNFSISSFIHSMKFCFYDHLESSRVNLLFHSDQSNKKLNESILKCLRNDSNNIYHQRLLDIFALDDIINDYKQINAYNIDLIKYWRQVNAEYIFILQILSEIIHYFPSEIKNDDNNDDGDDDDYCNESLFNEKNKSFVNLYIRMCHFRSKTSEVKFTGSQHFKHLKNLLLLSSNSTIGEIMIRLNRLITRLTHNNGQEAVSFRSEFLKDISNFQSILNNVIQALTCSTAESDVENVQIKSNTLTRRQSTRKSLKPLNESTNESTTIEITTTKVKNIKIDIESLKRLFIDWLHRQFIQYLDSDDTLADSLTTSLFYYDNINKLKNRCFNDQRFNIHKCLIDPFERVQLLEKYSNEIDVSPKKRRKSSTKVSTMDCINQDVLPLSVVYKLYLEFGNMINLYDWLQVI
jgi:hypothetical protein